MKKNSRLGLWALAGGAVLAAAARIAQICSGTDMNSGFLKDDNGFFMDFCFWGAVLLTIAGAVAAAVLDRKKEASYYEAPVSAITDGRAAAIGFALLLPAMGALYEGYCEATIPAESNFSPSPFMMFVNFLFGGAMLATAFVILYQKEFKPGLGFATVCGAGYYTLRGIGIFMEKMAVTTVPEYLINCVSVILAAIFFMQLAKLLSGNEGKRTREALAVSGAAAAATILGNTAAALGSMLFAPADVATRIVAASSEAELLHQQLQGKDAYFMALVPAADAAAGVFILVTLIALFWKPAPAAEEAESGASLAAEEDVQDGEE